MTKRLSTSAKSVLKGYETGGRMVGKKLVLLKKGEPALKTYIDDVGVKTIGWGHTGPVRGEKLTMATEITLAEAEELFKGDIRDFEDCVNRACEGYPTTQGQFDAMVLLAYNIGESGFEKSTLLKHHRARRFDAAHDQFARWNKGRVNGKMVSLNGLTRRRAEEAAMYARKEGQRIIKPDQTFIVSTVAESKRATPEAPPAPGQSPGVIAAIGAAIPAGAVTVETVTQASSSIKEVRAEADQVEWLTGVSGFLGVVVVLMSAYIVWRRFRDSRKGLK